MLFCHGIGCAVCPLRYVVVTVCAQELDNLGVNRQANTAAVLFPARCEERGLQPEMT